MTHSKNAIAFVVSLLGIITQSALGQNNIVSGSGEVVHADTQHPAGNVYDQLLITGHTLTVRADPWQIVRIAFLDLDGDIVQCEFSGAGTMTVAFDPETYSEPAPASLYNQPDTLYAQGHASVTLDGTDAFSSVSIYSIGTATSDFQALFKEGVTYDGLADLQSLRINGEAISNVFAGNVRFTAHTGIAGIDAPHTAVQGRLIFHDIEAYGDAQAALRLSEASPLSSDSGAILIAGGDLRQPNGASVDIRSSNQTANLSLKTVAGIRSNGAGLEAADIPRSVAWIAGTNGSVIANGETFVTRGLATYPADISQLESHSRNPFFMGDDNEGFVFKGQTFGEWFYTETQEQEGITASIMYSGEFDYLRPENDDTSFQIKLDYHTHTVNLAGFSRSTLLEGQNNPPLPKSAVISVSSDGYYESLLTLTDGTEKANTGTYDNVSSLPLPGLE